MMDERKNFVRLLEKVQVNVPFKRLKGEYLPLILEYGINPEIGFDADTLDSVSEKAFGEVAEILKTNHRNLTLHGPFMDLVPGGLDAMLLAATRKRLERFFEIVPVFEPINVVCHAGYDPCYYRKNWEEWRSNSVETWKPYVRIAERSGFKLLLENVYERGPKVHAALFDAIPSGNFGCCFDVGHHNVFGKSPLREWIQALGEKIMELHLHDNDGAEDTHQAIGTGNVDFVDLFQVMAQNGLTATITLEPHEEETLWRSLASDDFKKFVENLL